MRFFAQRQHRLTAISVLYQGFCFATEPTVTPPIASPTSLTVLNSLQPLNGTCESRTINYITHSLPQACLRYSRSEFTGPEPTSASEARLVRTQTRALPSETANRQADIVSAAEANIDSDSALDESSFLSFEDWKKQTLEKEGLGDIGAGEKRPQPYKDADKRRGSDGIQDALKALEEDVTIETDFTSFLTDQNKESLLTGPHDEEVPTKHTLQDTVEETDLDGRPRHPSKDAGKTCKERFNFASLDAGGQVMKTNIEAKSASALLREDRDVYMLNPCQMKNKFIIVELSESILVDTVAIANFEFFSSTFRRFRVSVSDRYPTKLDRWVDLGTFEARNSRDIQAFLVQDPRIWARYFRIEFISHYGNEFYCPISLLRVHGRTMIQDVLNMEESTRVEDDAEDDIAGTIEENDGTIIAEGVNDVSEDERVAEGLKEAEAALGDLVRIAEAITPSEIIDAIDSSQIIQVMRGLEDITTRQMSTSGTSPKLQLEDLFEKSHRMNTCLPSEFPSSKKTVQENSLSNTIEYIDVQSSSVESFASSTTDTSSAPTAPPTGGSKQTTGEQNIANPHYSYLATSQSVTDTPGSATDSSTRQTSTTSSTSPDASSIGTNKPSNKSSATFTSHGAQPTTQESFFKTVSKRLQLLEANSTLSLKYIEDQSRILRDAFTKVEKRQLAKTTSFLENLNDTVLDELRRFNQQYDQIWQSTVMELETQRDESQREIAAVTTRLSLLADELVFQKRMSIVQSILLLLCLGLVIFSRGFTGNFDTPIVQQMVSRPRNSFDPAYASSSSNPAAQRAGFPPQSRPWLSPGRSGHLSEGSLGSLRSGSRENSPPTPFSNDFRQGESSRMQKEHHELFRESRRSLVDSSSPTQGTLLPVGDYDTIPRESHSPGNYPDFKNSALWISTGPHTFKSRVTSDQPYTDMRRGSREHSPDYETNSLNDILSPIQSTEEQGDAIGLGSSVLPSPPPEREKPEFSIARKPLPAIPKNDH